VCAINLPASSTRHLLLLLLLLWLLLLLLLRLLLTALFAVYLHCCCLYARTPLLHKHNHDLYPLKFVAISAHQSR
jgi:hypothetical protein